MDGITGTNERKKLVRPRDGRMIGGVALGFARYLNVDATLIRLALVALVLCAGTGIVLYLVAWILIPEEG